VNPAHSCLLAASLALGAPASSQSVPASKPAIRHHRVEVADDQFPPELRQAEDALNNKDYATAEKLLDTLTARDPKAYRAWFDLGFVYTAQGRDEQSVAAYRQAVAAKPDVFESNLNLGLMLARTHNQEAETFLRAATRLKPTDKVDEGLGRAWLSLAHVLEADKPEEAVKAYREALGLRPNTPDTHLALGSVLERQKDTQGAEEQYQRALSLASAAGDGPSSAGSTSNGSSSNGSSSAGSSSKGSSSKESSKEIAGQAVTALANLYMLEKRFPEAEAMLRKLAAASSGDAILHLQLGRVLAAEGKFDEASDEMEAGLKLAPKDLSALRDLADLDLLRKKYSDAEPLYRQLLQAQPKDADLHHSLGKSLLDQRKFPEAQAEFVSALNLKPDSGEAYWDLAVAADQNKDFALAIKALDARARYLPELPFGYFLRATAYDHLRDHKNAAIQYHRFLDVSSGQFPDQEWQARHRLIAIEPKK
jgi:tetratricopeptide (TPR) repeat protein